MRQQYKGQLEQLIDKVSVYEGLLHDIQTYAVVTMDQPPIAHLIDLVCAWSYSHRVGNGEYTDAEQEELVNRQYQRLKDREYTKSVWNSGFETEHKARYRESIQRRKLSLDQHGCEQTGKAPNS